MVVVVGEAGEAGHAAGVVVAEPLQQLAQFLPALLVLQYPLLLLLGGHPVHRRRERWTRHEGRWIRVQWGAKNVTPIHSIDCNAVFEGGWMGVFSHLSECRRPALSL